MSRRRTLKPSGATSSPWDGSDQNRYGVPQQNPDEQANKKTGRMNALPSDFPGEKVLWIFSTSYQRVSLITFSMVHLSDALSTKSYGFMQI